MNYPKDDTIDCISSQVFGRAIAWFISLVNIIGISHIIISKTALQISKWFLPLESAQQLIRDPIIFTSGKIWDPETS